MSWLSNLFGGGGGDSEAARARQDEEERQKRIREGTSRIGELFFGGKPQGTGKLTAGTAYDPSKQYYDASGNLWTPKTGISSSTTTTTRQLLPESGGMGGGGNAGREYPRYGNVTTVTPGTPYGDPTAQFASALGGGLFSGKETSTGSFGGDFFDKRRQSYVDFATPQLQDQYGKAQEQLTYALGRSHMLDSSVRGEKEGELTKLFDLNKQNVADQALSYETQSRNSVEDAKQSLIGMLNTTGDVQGTVNSAITRAQALSQPPAYNPLTQLFADFTNALGMQAAQERSFGAGGPAPRYNTGLFSRDPNASVSVAN